MLDENMEIDQSYDGQLEGQKIGQDTSLSPSIAKLRQELSTITNHVSAVAVATDNVAQTQSRIASELAMMEFGLTNAEPGQVPNLSAEQLAELGAVKISLQYQSAQSPYRIGKKRIEDYGSVTYRYEATEVDPEFSFDIELSSGGAKITLNCPGNETQTLRQGPFFKEFKEHFNYAQITVGTEHSNLEVTEDLGYVCNCDCIALNTFEFDCGDSASMSVPEKFDYVRRMLKGFFEAKGLTATDIDLTDLSTERVNTLREVEAQQTARLEQLVANGPENSLSEVAKNNATQISSVLSALVVTQEKLQEYEDRYQDALEIDLMLDYLSQFPYMHSTAGGVKELAAMVNGIKSLDGSNSIDDLKRKLRAMTISLEEIAKG